MEKLTVDDGELEANIGPNKATSAKEKPPKVARNIKVLEARKGPQGDLFISMSRDERQVAIDELKATYPNMKIIDDINYFIDEKAKRANLLSQPKLKELLLRKIIECTIEITKIKNAHLPLNSDVTTSKNFIVPLIEDFVELKFYGEERTTTKYYRSRYRKSTDINMKIIGQTQKDEPIKSLSIRNEYPLLCMTRAGKKFVKAENQEMDIIGLKLGDICAGDDILGAIHGPCILAEKKAGIVSGAVNFGSLSVDCEGYINQPKYELAQAIKDHINGDIILFDGLKIGELTDLLTHVFTHVKTIYLDLINKTSYFNASFYVQALAENYVAKEFMSKKFVGLVKEVNAMRAIKPPAYKEFILPPKDPAMKLLEGLFGVKNQDYLDVLFSFDLGKLYYEIKLRGMDDKGVKAKIEAFKENKAQKDSAQKQAREAQTELYLTNFYLMLVEKLFGAKRYNKLLDDLFKGTRYSDDPNKNKLLYTRGKDALFKRLSDNERKTIISEYDKMLNYFQQMSKNKCPHLAVTRRLSHNKDPNAKQSSLFKRLQNFLPSETGLNKLFKEINKGRQLSRADMIPCNTCSFDLICPHLYEWHKNLAPNQRNFNIMLKYVDKEPIRSYYYCKICRQQIAHIDTFTNAFQSTDQAVYDSISEDLRTLMWGEINAMLFYVQFDKLVNINKLIRQITVGIYNFILEVDKQLSVAKTNTNEDIHNKIKLFINIYAYAYLINLMKDYDYIRFKKMKSKKPDLKAIILTAINTLISSKNIVIKNIPNINNEFIKNKLLEAFGLIKRSGKKEVEFEDVSRKSVKNINYDPIYTYLYIMDLSAKGKTMASKYAHLTDKSGLLAGNYESLANPFLGANIGHIKAQATGEIAGSYWDFIAEKDAGKRAKMRDQMAGAFIFKAFMQFWSLIDEGIFNIFLHSNEMMNEKYVKFQERARKLQESGQVLKEIKYEFINLQDLPFSQARNYVLGAQESRLSELYDENGRPHKFDKYHYDEEAPMWEKDAPKQAKEAPSRKIEAASQLRKSMDKSGGRRNKHSKNKGKYTKPSGPESSIYGRLFYELRETNRRYISDLNAVQGINKRISSGKISPPTNDERYISGLPILNEGEQSSSLFIKNEYNINEDTGLSYGNVDWGLSHVYLAVGFSDKDVEEAQTGNVRFKVFYDINQAERTLILTLFSRLFNTKHWETENMKKIIKELNRFMARKELPKMPITFSDVEKQFPDPVKYMGELRLPPTVIHYGQSKLFFTELELFNLALDSVNDKGIMVYVGAAPCYHITMLKYMYPNVKFVLIDPANFYLAKIPGVEMKAINIKTDRTASELWDTCLKYMAEYDFIIINGLFDPDFAKAIAEHPDPAQIMLVSDIRAKTARPDIEARTDMDAEEKLRCTSSPGDIDILRDLALQAIWYHHLTVKGGKLKAYMYKHRCPFMSEEDYAFTLQSTTYDDLFDEVKALTGHSIKDLYVANQILEPKGEPYLQTRCGQTSSEVRLIDVAPKGQGLKTEWQLRNTKHFENILFAHNLFNRRFFMFDTPVVNTNLGLCRCYDCARHCQLLKDYVERRGISEKGLEHDIIQLTLLSEHTNFGKPLVNARHMPKYHMYTPWSAYYLIHNAVNVLIKEKNANYKSEELENYRKSINSFKQHNMMAVDNLSGPRNYSGPGNTGSGGPRIITSGRRAPASRVNAWGVAYGGANLDDGQNNHFGGNGQPSPQIGGANSNDGNKKIINKECSTCGVKYDATDKLDESKIESALELKKDVANIHLFYFNKCPVEGYHEWTANVCKKCGQNRSYDEIDITNKDLVGYYEKYKDQYIKELKQDEVGQEDVGRYEFVHIDKIKAELKDELETHEFSNLTDFAAAIGVEIQLLYNLGGIEKYTIRQVKSGNVILPQNIDVYTPRIFRLIFYNQYLVRKYNYMININKLVSPPADLIKILNDSNIRKYEYNLLPKALDVIVNPDIGYERDINLYREKNNAINSMLFNFLGNCNFILDFEDRPNILVTKKLRHNFLVAIIKQILKFDEDTSIPGEVNWNLFKKELKNSEFAEKRGIKMVVDEAADFIDEGQDKFTDEDDHDTLTMGERDAEEDEENKIKNTDEDLKNVFDMEDNSAWEDGDEDVDNDVTMDDSVVSGIGD